MNLVLAEPGVIVGLSLTWLSRIVLQRVIVARRIDWHIDGGLHVMWSLEDARPSRVNAVFWSSVNRQHLLTLKGLVRLILRIDACFVVVHFGDLVGRYLVPWCLERRILLLRLDHVVLLLRVYNRRLLSVLNDVGARIVNADVDSHG